jgi:hypothetical protein
MRIDHRGLRAATIGIARAAMRADPGSKACVLSPGFRPE